MFNNLNRDGLEESRDSLGGGYLLDTDSYDATIKMAYGIKSAKGAMGAQLVFDIGGKDYRETVYVTNQAGENYFLNQGDKTKKVPLPGFVVMDDLCLVTVEKPLSEVVTEEKVVNVFDFESKKDVPTKVPVLTELIGKQVTLGIVRQTVNKNVKNPQTDKYEPTADTRDENVIEKVFQFESKGTVNEAREQQPLGDFHAKWVERNKGNTRDKRKIKDGQGGTAGRPGAGGNAGPPVSGGQPPRTSLFGNKG